MNSMTSRIVSVFIAPVLTIILFAFSILAFILPAFESAVIDQKKETLRELSRVATNTLNRYRQAEKEGLLTREEAQQQAAEQIRGLRYGAEEKDYFWIHDMNGTMIVHPWNRSLEGTNVLGFEDPDGVRLFQEAVDKLQNQQEAFIRYKWQWKDDAGLIEEKLSNVRLFRDWGWIIGTGVYLNDVENQAGILKSHLLWITGAILLLITLLAARDIYRQLCVVRQRAETEKALGKSENRYRELVENAGSIILRINHEGTITFINSYGCSFFGYPENGLLHQPASKIIPEQDSQGMDLTRLVENIFQDPEAYKVNQNENIRSDGERVWVAWANCIVQDETGRPELLSIGNDITLRKQLEDELRQLSQVTRQCGEGVVITDTGGKISYINPAFEEICGKKLSQVISVPATALCHGKHPELERDIPEILLSGCTWLGCMKEERADGSPLELELSISPVRNEAGIITCFVALCRDISTIAAAERQRQQSQKLEALGILAGGIAHDFNNILSIIKGYADLALAELYDGKTDDLLFYLTEVMTAGNRARDLVARILAFSRKTEHTRKPVYLQEVICEVHGLLRATTPSFISIETDIEEECGPVNADPTCMYQILINLCSNAVTAMENTPGKLKIRLNTESIGEESLHDRHSLKPGRYVHLSVSDSGHGISEEIMNRIFDPFFTTRKPGKGTGLGLATVHGIVTKHNGVITVRSRPGKGTVFHIYLPESETIPRQKPVSSAIAIARGNNEHVLLVDDEPGLLEVSRRALERLGYHVTAFTSPEKALAFFCCNRSGIDIVITDHTMPGMPGLEFAAAVSREDNNIPIILTSGSLNIASDAELKRYGIRSHMMKPVSITLLCHEIQRLLHEKSTRSICFS